MNKNIYFYQNEKQDQSGSFIVADSEATKSYLNIADI
jgi:hypothetical protein